MNEADDTSYVFARESQEEKVLVVFNDGPHSRELRMLVADTARQRSRSVALLLGGATAVISAGEIDLQAPAESLSIFAMR
jgi:hypothetical protein